MYIAFNNTLRSKYLRDEVSKGTTSCNGIYKSKQIEKKKKQRQSFVTRTHNDDGENIKTILYTLWNTFSYTDERLNIFVNSPYTSYITFNLNVPVTISRHLIESR